MHKNQRLQLKIAIAMLVRFCLASIFIVTFLLYPSTPSASAETSTSVVNDTRQAVGAGLAPTLPLSPAGPTLLVKAAFNTRYRDGNWVPVQITLDNNGADFSGTLTISVPPPSVGQANSTPSSTSYKEAISLANGAQKQVTMYVPLYSGIQGLAQTLNIHLLDDNGNIVRTQASTLTSLGPDDVFVGILSDASSGFDALSSIELPSQSGLIVEQTLDAGTMPSIASVLNNFDLIVLDDFTTNNLNNDQLTALQTWVDQGGALIEVGGTEWRRTLSPLPASLLPISISGTSTLPAGTRLLPINGPHIGGSGKGPKAGTINAPVTVSTATLALGSYPIVAGASPATTFLPLIVQKHQGQGSICYLAFDPTVAPIISWPYAGALWRDMIFRSIGDKLLSASSFVPAIPFPSLSALLQNLQPDTLPAPWLLLILLLSYLIMLGPVRFLIVRWRKRRNWNWHIVLSSIIVFSLLTYGLAIHQNGTSIVSNSVSVLQLNQGSPHITTYLGVIVPQQGDYQVHIPGNTLVQPALSDPSFAGEQTTITAGQNGTDVNLQGVNSWSMHSLLSNGASQVHGGIRSQLTLANGMLTGTVTNTLHYSLNDVYVLMPNSFVRIGDLLAGQTQQVHLTLNTTAGNPGMTLADQIAQSYQFPAPYSAITSGSSSMPQVLQNKWQRHLAILAALSGESSYSACISGSCSNTASSSAYIAPRGRISDQGSANLPGGQASATLNYSDPLLAAGSPATLIGWVDQPTDLSTGATVNGISPSGTSETLVQAGLNVNYSGTGNLPANSFRGQLIDVQGKHVQVEPDGAYIMTTDSMTFEFAVPESTRLHASGLTISEPSNLPPTPASFNLPASTSLGDANDLQAYLYNWRANSWDAFTLSGNTLSASNAGAYIGPGGRILLQYANQSSVLTLVFGKPSLTLQGTG